MKMDKAEQTAQAAMIPEEGMKVHQARQVEAMLEQHRKQVEAIAAQHAAQLEAIKKQHEAGPGGSLAECSVRRRSNFWLQISVGANLFARTPSYARINSHLQLRRVGTVFVPCKNRPAFKLITKYPHAERARA